jgi:hypothetical protein
MPTAFTPLLGLALPVQGELSGTWGDTVNSSITNLLDTAVAGTTTLSTDGNVTLTSSTGVSDQARSAVVLLSGARTAIRTVTAPARSKVYVVVNATTGGFATQFVGVGPTTGVTVASGTTVILVWNGADFVQVYADTVTLTGTQTLTNKRITLRINAQTTTTSPWAWNSDSYDQQSFSALANALTINADAGTPTDGQKTVFRFTDNGTARALTWTTGTSKSFRSVGTPLPTTTVVSKTLYVACIYNSTAARWDVLAVAQET